MYMFHTPKSFILWTLINCASLYKLHYTLKRSFSDENKGIYLYMGIKIKLNRQFNTNIILQNNSILLSHRPYVLPTQSCLLVSVNALRHCINFVKWPIYSTWSGWLLLQHSYQCWNSRHVLQGQQLMYFSSFFCVREV